MMEQQILLLKRDGSFQVLNLALRDDMKYMIETVEQVDSTYLPVKEECMNCWAPVRKRQFRLIGNGTRHRVYEEMP